MVTERDVLTGLLNCGYEEVNMLLKSNIDFHKKQCAANFVW